MVEAPDGVGTAGRPLWVLGGAIVRRGGLLGLAGLHAVEVQQVLGHDGGAAWPRAALQAKHVQQGALKVAEQLMAWAAGGAGGGGGGQAMGGRATPPFLWYQTGMASLPQQDVA